MATECRASVPDALEALAEVFAYPRADYVARLATARAAVECEVPGAGASLAALGAHCAATDLAGWEELHVRSFDLDPVCALEVGWQLYGEQYARGTFLASMRAYLRTVGVAEDGELPDHLVPTLRGAARGERALSSELVRRFVLPAVERMRTRFADEAHPYRGALDAVAAVLATRVVPAGGGEG